MQAQMQAEYDLRDAKLRTEQRWQEILARISFKDSFRISYKIRLFSRKCYSGMEPDVSAIFGCSKKVDNQVAASKIGETDVGPGAADGAWHTLEPLRVIASEGKRCLNPGALKQF